MFIVSNILLLLALSYLSLRLKLYLFYAALIFTAINYLSLCLGGYLNLNLEEFLFVFNLSMAGYFLGFLIHEFVKD